MILLLKSKRLLLLSLSLACVLKKEKNNDLFLNLYGGVREREENMLQYIIIVHNPSGSDIQRKHRQ
jgi:hypothetical protein